MNDRVYDQPPSGHRVPHAEASVDIGAASTNTSEQIQVPQSPQPLSLQINGINGRAHAKIDSTDADIEPSERGSDTSVDGQRPELQSASTFTDSIPSSSVNDSTRSMELDSFQTPKEDAPVASTSPQDPLRVRPVHGDAPVENDNYAVKIEESNHDSLPPLRSPSQFKSRAANGTSFTPGHKRTATGDIKSVSSGKADLHSADVNGTRRRSKSTGASTHGSRIAQLSVHIRTRLSYAAAKIEKSRQSQEASTQLPFRGLENLSSWSPPGQNSAQSTPGTLHASLPQHKSNPSSTDTPRLYPSHHRSQSAVSSPGKPPPIPKLAPPVDITSNGDTRRRRPNPNMNPRPFDHSPYARHRRHHSHQEPPAARLNDTPGVLGPGTPTFTPSSCGPTSAHNGFYRPRTHSENTSMEQDAIETLLFMSSPENSGYRSSPRPLQPPATQISLNATLSSSQNGIGGGHSQPPPGDKSRPRTNSSHRLRGARAEIEDRAGDEIDRLLDQMDSDSEDEGRYASHRGTTRAGRRAG